MAESQRTRLLKKLIELGCYKEGKFTLKSGRESSYYIDLRCLVSYPEVLKEVSALIYNKIKDTPGLICGLPYAGIPYAMTLSAIYNIPSVLLRKERKSYGTGKMVEGNYKLCDKLIIIDDILTTGQSIQESMKYLADFYIQKIIVIIDREESDSILESPMESIFTLSELKEVYSTMKSSE